MAKSLVRFGYADSTLSVTGKRDIQFFVAEIFAKELNVPCKLQYVFCSDTFLLDINVSYLQHDDYTDIITFDLSEDRNNWIEGEIYISVDRVKANAKLYNVSFLQELLRVIFHGALHLCGYGDKTIAQKSEMRRKEEEYLNLYLSR